MSSSITFHDNKLPQSTKVSHLQCISQLIKKKYIQWSSWWWESTNDGHIVQLKTRAICQNLPQNTHVTKERGNKCGKMGDSKCTRFAQPIIRVTQNHFKLEDLVLVDNYHVDFGAHLWRPLRGQYSVRGSIDADIPPLGFPI